MCINIMDGVHGTDHITHETMRHKYDLPPIKWWLRVARLRWEGHVRRMPANLPRLPYSIFHSDIPSDLTQTRLRNFLTWRKIITNDHKALDLNEDQLDDIVQDRKKGREITHT